MEIDYWDYHLRRLFCVGLALLTLFALGSCQTGDDLRDITVADLVGTWKADYSQSAANVDPSGVEIIVLKNDGTYQQTYTDNSGVIYQSHWLNWSLDEDKVVHLESGLWFPLGVREAREAAQGAVLSIPIQGTRVEVNLGREVLLLVSIQHDHILLSHLSITDPDSLGTVYFERVTVLPPTPSGS
jgi:hypothetical protein